MEPSVHQGGRFFYVNMFGAKLLLIVNRCQENYRKLSDEARGQKTEVRRPAPEQRNDISHKNISCFGPRTSDL